MRVDDSFNYHAVHARLCTIIVYHQLSTYHQLSGSLDMFKFHIIVDDSFCHLNKQMMVNNSFPVRSIAKKGLKLKWQMVK